MVSQKNPTFFGGDCQWCFFFVVFGVKEGNKERGEEGRGEKGGMEILAQFCLVEFGFISYLLRRRGSKTLFISYLFFFS